MKLHLVLFLLIVNTLLFSQEKCLSYKVILDQINNATNPQTVLDELEALKNTNFTPTKAGNIISIPIVFHIVHNGDSLGENENLTDSIILEQLERINIDFRAQNIDTANIPNEFKALLADTEIEFCLAKKDTSGNFTNGIIRHNLGQTGWNENDINNTVKPTTIWNRDNYLNVWTFNFDGNLATNNVNGYATPPFASTDFDKDGIVLNYTKVGNNLNSDIGRTLVHEIGHWLGLLHIWGDDNGACTGDDGIADTPNQADSYSNCPSGTPNSCSSNDMFMNYMDYTDADCSLMFTVDQKNKMLSVLNGFRVSILSSTACTITKDLIIEEIIYPNGTICQLSYLPVIKIKNIGTETVHQYGFDFYIDTVLQESFLIDLDVLPGETKYVQGNTTNDYSENWREVKFVVQSGDNNEYNLNNEKMTTYTTINTGSGMINFMYDFEDDIFPPSTLIIENEDNDTSWVEYKGDSTTLIMIHNSSETIGKKDAFTTTDFSFLSYLKVLPEFSFNYYYNVTPSLSDTLTVYYSLDCGAHWVPFWSKNGLELSNNTIANIPTAYTNQEFQLAKVSLNDIFGYSVNEFNKIRYKFENKSGGGNNVYIDNINSKLTGVAINELDKTQIKVYPNPTKDILNITQEESTLLAIEIVDISGKILLQKNISSKEETISIKEFPKGVYFLKIAGATDFYVHKILKN